MSRAAVVAVVLLAGSAVAAHAQSGAPEDPPGASTANASGVPPPTPQERADAFPDLGGMDMRAHMIEDPWVTSLRLDRLEGSVSGGPGASAWDMRGWSGHDADRLWLRSEGERRDGHSEGDLELAWWHALSPWWNGLLGARHDLGADGRDWAALGVEGTAPYRIEVLGMLYLGEGGRWGARAEAEYDLLLTQRWVLQPRLEAATYTGQGVPDDGLSAGVRLRYEIRREFAPYLGLERHWIAGAGGAGDSARTETRWVLGLRLGL